LLNIKLKIKYVYKKVFIYKGKLFIKY